MYFVSAALIGAGVLAMRWNVVIGGQLFSKSLRGVMSYKMEFAGVEGWLMGAVLLALPFAILIVFVQLFLSEKLPSSEHGAGGGKPPHGTGAPLGALPQA
jgi:predicted membrane protein